MSEAAPAQTAKSVADRASRRTMSERRRRVWLNVAVFSLVTAAMVVLSMAHRDHQSVRSCQRRLEFARQELQKLLDDSGRVAPESLPLEGWEEVTQMGEPSSPAEQEMHDEYYMRREHYFYNSRYGRQLTQRRLVGVCCCAAPHRLYLQADGRYAIVFDGQRYELRWMTEREFHEQAAALKLILPAQP